MHALQASDGTEIWRHVMGTWPAVQGAEDMSASRPSVVNGILYIASNQHVFALRASDGSPLWQAAPSALLSEKLAVANGDVYVSASTGKLYALKASDGSQAWTAQASTSGGVAGPVATDGKVFFACVGLGSPNLLYAFDGTSGNALWQTSVKSGGYGVSLTATAGAIYMGLGGSMSAFSENNGAPLWQTLLNNGYQASPVTVAP
jgi:outer membrane protein assembly factor BamB